MPVDEVPDAIYNLLNWINAELDKVYNGKISKPEAVVLAFEFHIRYIAIHPFYDGNGRTARIFMNLLLISLGFPPVIIKKGLEEQQYKQYLADVQAYGGSPDLFYELMAALLIRSHELVLRAIDGEKIDEEEDWKKELRWIKQNLGKNEIKTKNSNEVIVETLRLFGIAFYLQIKSTLRELEELFFESEIYLGACKIELSEEGIKWNQLNDITSILKISNFSNFIRFEYILLGYKSNIHDVIDVKTRINFYFKDYSYTIQVQNSFDSIEKFYQYPLTDKDTSQIINEVGKELISQIKSKVREL